MTNTISNAKLQELLAKIKKEKESQPAPAPTPTPNQHEIQSTGKHGELITLNKEQSEFVSLTLQGSSCVLIGAAGTGKTTCMKATITSLIQSSRIPTIQNGSHKYLPNSGVPGIVACSFTRRAVANLRKAMPSGMERNCITIHKLLEYQPVSYQVEDPETGETKTKKVFEPTRNKYNPLDSSIKVIIIDEASMVSLELFNLLLDALDHEVQFIFLGDIQQLPPVFGSAILGFKMIELPCIELIQVYRQALESPIIKYATQIKDGKVFNIPDVTIEETPKGKITFHPWKKSLDADVAKFTFCKFITQALAQGSYDPANDCILIPFNKSFGTDDVNKHIANFIAKQAQKPVYEIIAGFNKLYFSIGDYVLYDKEDAVITDIKRNPAYLGKQPQPESVTLDYHGINSGFIPETTHEDQDVDTLLDSMSELSELDERVKACSHIVTVKMEDSQVEIELTTASDLNTLLLSYALTAHKAQGSEWDKVFFILHQFHNVMVQRELLYTGMTRAAKELYVICEKDTFIKGVKSQKIKGNTLAEKAEVFKGALERTNKKIQ